MKRRYGLPVGVLLLLGAAWPARADAHGYFITPDVPIPPWLFAVAAAVIVFFSFIAISALWSEPRFADRRWRPIGGNPGKIAFGFALDAACGVLGVFILGLVIYAGLAGEPARDENFATVFVFIIFWIGLAVASAFFGDLFRPFNPWRAIGRAAGATVGRYVNAPLGPDDANEPPIPYPAWLGRLPAALGLFGFAYLELASGRTPRDVALATLVYSLFTLGAMALFGVERWCERGEAFSTYFGFFSRIAPLEVRQGRLGLRRPLSALTDVSALPGTALVVATIIGAVTFDGARGTEAWRPLGDRVVDLFDGPFSAVAAARLTNAIGIALAIGWVFVFYRIGILGASGLGGGARARRMAQRFAPTLVPIALAYTLAHYMQYLVIPGQGIVAAVSDPLASGANLFGTADWEPNAFISPNAFWYAEVAVIVIGHVAATVLSHDVALADFGKGSAAAWSQRWMVVVMAGFSVLALWLLADASEISFGSPFS